MKNVIPFKRKKQQLDWIAGITPRKEKSRRWRIPPALPGGLVVAALIAMVIWLPRLGPVVAGWLDKADHMVRALFH